MRAKKKTMPVKPIHIHITKHEDGSQLIAKRYKDVVTIHLKLVDQREKNLGRIILKDRIFQVIRKRDKHLFWKKMAYGFNHYILLHAKLFDSVHLKDEKCDWIVPREWILEHGEFMNFKNNGGFELQLFVTLLDLTPFETTSPI